MADETIRIDLELAAKTNGAKPIKEVTKNLHDAEKAANQLREKMEKVAQVGQKMAMAGAAIAGPFLLAFGKWAEGAKAAQQAGKTLTEEQKRFLAVQDRLAKVQERIGAVVAKTVVPALEKAAGLLEKFADFAEKNPGAIEAALGIGGTLVVLGGIVSTAAQVVSTIATMQGLFAGLAGAGGIGGAASTAGAVGGAAAGGITLGAIAPAAVTVLALGLGAEIGRQIGSAIVGRDVTWNEIGNTVKQLLVLSAEGWTGAIRFFTGWDVGLGDVMSRITGQHIQEQYKMNQKAIDAQRTAVLQAAATTVKVINGAMASVADAIKGVMTGMTGALSGIAQAIQSAFSSLAGIFQGKKAGGGYARSEGLYRMAEAGPEYVLPSDAVKAIERATGRRVTTESIVAAVAERQRNYSMVQNPYMTTPMESVSTPLMEGGGVGMGVGQAAQVAVQQRRGRRARGIPLGSYKGIGLGKYKGIGLGSYTGIALGSYAGIPLANNTTTTNINLSNGMTLQSASRMTKEEIKKNNSQLLAAMLGGY